MSKNLFVRIIAIVVLAVLAFSFSACTDNGNETSKDTSKDSSEAAAETGAYGFVDVKDLAATGVVSASAPAVTGDVSAFKVGVILIGDETEGYSKAHIDGIKKAASELGINDANILWRRSVPESQDVVTSCDQLVAEGCNVIFTNSYGHQSYTLEAAKKYKDVQFVAVTGDTAAAVSAAGVATNFSNAFNKVFESRYVSGVVAGLKLKELVDNGTLTKENHADSFDANGNIKIGYVGAFSFAEVMSGYTSFFLGVKSVVSNVSMEVYYTKSWSAFDAEKSAAEYLIGRGCVIIGQHADTAGAPTAVETAFDSGKLCFSVGYNVTMLDVAADSCLTSASADWSAYYKYAMATAINGEKIATNWAGGYAENALAITELGTSCAAGTAEYVANVEAQIKAGTLKVFDTSKFTVGGKNLTWAFGTDSDGDFAYDCNNVIADGYFHESFVQSAPAFNILIDGITEQNQGF